MNSLEQAYLEELEFQDKARNSLAHFTLYTKPDYEPHWHHRVVCDKLDKFARKEIQRLILIMPPRHGKSELVSRRLPPFIFGRNPDAEIIATSYGSTLAQRMNRDVQRIMEERSYKKLFPEAKLPGKGVTQINPNEFFTKNSETFQIVDRKGVYQCAGIGGGIGGLGADYLIIDDPVKDMAQALSPTYRGNAWDWATSTAFTRLLKEGSILVTMTRWHEDDLVGRLLEQMEKVAGADQWDILKLPAIREDMKDESLDQRELGEALWPDRFPVSRLMKIKASNHLVWNGLYRGNPSFKDGNKIKKGWWKFYDVPPGHFDDYIMSWDMAFEDEKTAKDPDYVVGTVWGRKGANKYLLDMEREKMDFPDTIDAVKLMVAKWPQVRTILVEKKANGPAVIASLKNKIAGMIPVEPKGGKTARVIGISPQIKAGNVFLPDPLNQPWVADFITECSEFPKSKNDDMVDSMTQALSHWQENSAQDFEESHLQDEGSLVGEIIGGQW